ncbi:MAG: thioredoxin family protein [Ignavibacterium sp.]
MFNIIKERFDKSLTYEQFIKKIENYLENTNPDDLNESDKHLYEYTKLNLQRMNRIQKTYSISEEMKNALSKIKNKQYWIVLTEEWCGDSAQNTPIITRIAEANPIIELKILERDDNPDIIDHYLTDGKRKIPKVILFDENGNELFQWTERPKKASEFMSSLLNNGTPKEKAVEELQVWYNQNKGTELEKEFIEFLNQL